MQSSFSKHTKIVALAAIFFSILWTPSFAFAHMQNIQEDGTVDEQAPASESFTESAANEASSSGLQENALMLANDWLELMASQTSALSFEAVYVVTANGKDTMPYVWRNAKSPSGDRVEQLSSLNGPGFEQIAHLGKVSIFEPGSAPYSVAGHYVRSPIPDALLRHPSLIENAYDAILMGRGRISGRMSQQIRVVSKDKSRFGYHLWIDEESGLLLKLNTYDLDGQLIEQMQITQLNITPSVDVLFENFNPEHLPDLRPDFAHEQKELAWDISYLPLGMEVVKKSLHRIQNTGQLTEYMLLSDGMVDVSVYLFEANQAFAKESSWHSGQNAIVSRSDGRVQVTVLGRIPETTANKIADSIIIVDNEQP